MIIVNLILLLGYFNWSVYQKEQTLKDGQLVLLQLAPVDPRSLMQGDYMRLNYKEASSNLPDEQTDTRGYAILRTDSNQVGEIVRLQNTLEPVNDNELVIRYKIINIRLFLGATSVPGIDWVLDVVGLDQALLGADLCITGEGHADAQSAHGKVVSGVASRCKRLGVPCIAIVGGMDPGALDLMDLGVDALVPTVIDCGDVADALAHAERNYHLAAARVFSLMALGKGLPVT